MSDELAITLEASSQALAYGSSGGVGEGGAELDAYLLFDQFNFDTAMAALGVTPFELTDYFTIEYGIGNSVVPGLPNRYSTPSCFSRSRKARFPDMTGQEVLPTLW